MMQLEMPEITVMDIYRTLRKLPKNDREELQAIIDDVPIIREMDHHGLNASDYGD